MTESPKNTPAPSPASPRKGPPQSIGKYHLVRQLGAGGMGAVFLATDTKTKRTVALKVLPRDKAKNEVLVKRFRAEAQAAANLEHENIVRVYEADESDGFLYIALEYVDGTDVAQLLKKRERLPAKRSTEIVKQVASALQHAHEQNIVHRDIKPSNLMIRKDGVVKLTDLGLARSVDETLDASITREGTTVGTVDYMAPEQARNSRLADIRSDLYSLGCTWYQMLTGHPPFHEGSLTNKLQAHSIQPPPNPRDENPDIPESSVAVLTRLMAKKPEDRYQTPRELLEDLNNAHMHRSSVSNNVFAALAVADDDSVDGVRGPGSGLPPRAAPPREKPAPRADDERSGFSLEQFKYVLAACGFVVVMLGIWWLVRGLAGGLDGNAPRLSTDDSQRNQARELLGADSPEPPSVGKAPDKPGAEKRPVDANLVGTNADAPKKGPQPGHSRVALGNDEDFDAIPDWAHRIPSAAEAVEFFAPLKLPLLTVGRSADRVGDKPSLDQALQELPKSGAIIQFLGDGPFVLTARELGDLPHLVLLSEPGRTPIVVVVAGARPPGDALLRIRNSKLYLLGIHLTAAAHQFRGERVASLLHASDSDFFARECSVTLTGTRNEPTAAIHLSGAGERGRTPQVLLDRTVISGSLTPLRQDRAAFDAVISHSMLLPHRGAAVVISGSIGGLPSTSKPAEDSRHVRLISSTIVGNDGSAVAIESGSERVRTAPVKWTVRRSLLAAAEGNATPLVTLRNWPYRDDEEPPLERFLWDSEHSRLVGWSAVVALTGTGELTLADRANWTAHLGDRYPLPEIAERHKPVPSTTSQPLLLSAWAPAALIEKLPSRLENELGCPSDGLTLPGDSALQVASAISRLESSMPTGLAADGQTIEIDLSKEDPGKRISADNWPSGTRFLIKGKGSRGITPIVVRGKSLRIEFDAASPESLWLEAGSRTAGDALIDVRGGSLELRNVRCRFLNRTRDPLPVAMVRVVDGSLTCENCEFSAPTLPNSAFRSIVQWELTPASERSQQGGQLHRHACELDRCFLVGMGFGVEATVDRCLVTLQNTVVATVGPALSLGGPDVPESIAEPSTVDVRRCTLTSADAIFEIRGAPPTGGESQYCFFTRQCVYAPPLPLGAKNVPATILSAAPAWRDGERLFWWEQANGYSTLFPCFQRAAGETANGQRIEPDWVQFWGQTRVRRPLTSPDGVLLVDEYPEFGKLVRSSFQMHASARANTWANDGTAIGADVAPTTAPKANNAAPQRTNPRALGF